MWLQWSCPNTSRVCRLKGMETNCRGYHLRKEKTCGCGKTQTSRSPPDMSVHWGEAVTVTPSPK
jgi:hypothetical protein